jgi:hypothetical protein
MNMMKYLFLSTARERVVKEENVPVVGGGNTGQTN